MKRRRPKHSAEPDQTPPSPPGVSGEDQASIDPIFLPQKDLDWLRHFIDRLDPNNPPKPKKAKAKHNAKRKGRK